MIVLHIAEYASGGIATYLKTLVNQQIRNQEISKIVIMVSDDKSQVLSFTSPKVQVIRYKYHRSLTGIIQILSLHRVIRKIHPDIIHLHSTFAGLIRVFFLFRRTTEPKIIYCSHGWSFARDEGKFNRAIYALVERILSNGCDAIINISHSEQTAATQVGIPARKMRVIYNSIEFVNIPMSESTASHKTFVFVGRFDRQKGIDVLLDVSRMLPRDIHVVLVGKPVLKDEVYSIQNLPGNVELCGWLPQDKVYERILHADGVIVPSRWEGFGLVAIEAMACGRAVIASDVGGLSEIVQDGLTGRLFTKGSRQELLKILCETDRLALAEMGARGYIRAKTMFQSNLMEKKVFEIYNK